MKKKKLNIVWLWCCLFRIHVVERSKWNARVLSFSFPFFFWARFIYFMCARRWNRGRTIWRVHGAEENRESNWRHWMKFHSKLNLVYMASFLSNSCSSSVNSWSWLESNDHLNVSTTGQSKNCCRETDVFVKEFGKNLAREILFLTFPRN